jgi:hypothetical protein
MNRHLGQPVEALSDVTVFPAAEDVRRAKPVASVAQEAAMAMRRVEQMAVGP